MRCNKLIRLTAIALTFTILFNICDLALVRELMPRLEVQGATAITTSNIESFWNGNKSNFNIGSDNKPTTDFWYDTSQSTAYFVDTDVHNEVEGLSSTVGTPVEKSEDGTIHIREDGTVADYAFMDNVGEDKIPSGSAIVVPSQSLYYTVEWDEALGGYYRQYYVSTANQLQYLLYKEATNFGGSVKANAEEIKRYYPDANKPIILNKVGFEILCDLDLGGANSQYWFGYSNDSVINEIKGKGHRVYNGYFTHYITKNSEDKNVTNCLTLFKNSAKRIAITDLDFSNNYMDRFGGVFGSGVSNIFLENVNFYSCVSYANSASSAICFGYGYKSVYVKNCMMRECAVYGTGGHSSTFASYDGSYGYKSDKSYIGDTTAGVTQYHFTSVPTLRRAQLVWLNKTVNIDGREWQLYATHPSIYENSMTIDSYVYDRGGEHSGTFVSCMQSGIIFKNCFTNSTIYAVQKAGCFIGCCIGSGDGFYHNVEGERCLVNAYFENCYASGLIEGRTNQGGFVGSLFNDGRSYNMPTNKATVNRGKCVFKNCYSTTSVGMQYSGGDFIGGFVGNVVGNGLAGNENDKAHMFINCYAAGEVGGIETNTSTDPSNKTTTGGFIGEYVDQTYTRTDGETFKERIKPEVINCYYDKQTTAMRERGIGCGSNTTDLNSEVEGLQGVYTKASMVKRVAGLADTVSMNDDVWTYVDGYYPELNVFMGENAKANFGDKADIAELYSRASVSTVFLDHWDYIMGENGNTGELAPATTYDTVRDISSKFEFSSGGNTDQSNIGWQLNEEKNLESSFPEHLGGTNEDGSPKGFSIDFSYTNLNGENSTVNQTYTPYILDIMADINEDGTDYTFKCFDFSEGKQFVKVVTCNGEDYAKWKAQQDKYTDYLNKLDEFTLVRSRYITDLQLEAATVTDEVIRQHLNERLNVSLNINASTPDETAIANRLAQVRELYNTTQTGTNEEKLSAARQLNTLLGFAISDTEETFVEQVAARTAGFELYTVYPFVAPDEVAIPSDFESFVNGEKGSRTLRLVPTAYLNAGGMISINVESPDVAEGGTQTGELKNSVSVAVGNDTLSVGKFDHTIGVAYSSTQGYPNNDKGVSTRLGNDTLYSNQVLKQNSDTYYDKDNGIFKKEALGYDENGDGTFDHEGDGVFALYDVYPSAKADAIRGDDVTVTSGFTSLTKQELLGNFCNDPVGQTKVEVYTTERRELTWDTDENGNRVATSFELDKKDRVDMSEDNNLAKWTGQQLFDVSDSGYYYMIYYWRMADGRYLEEYKLVKITANKFTVKMRTGVAGDTEDSFVYHSDGNVYYTSIDCDIFNMDSINSGVDDDTAVRRHYFPSDYYYGGHARGEYTDWNDFVDKTYVDYGEYLEYNEGIYWTKSMLTTTGDNQVCVAWRKSTDYALVKLMVEVRINNTWIPMAITGTTDQNTDLESHKPEFYYSYQSYDVVQNPQTNRFSVITTDNVVKTFAVSDALNFDPDGNGDIEAGRSSVRYINFKFFDDSAANNSINFNDDIRVTALFREVSANVVAEEDVLIDDGRDIAELVQAGGETLALDKAEEYRSVDNEGKTYDAKKAVLFGDKLIFRTKVKNIGHYDANNVIISQQVPEGLTPMEGTVKLYKQERTLNTYGEDTFSPPTEVTLTQMSREAILNEIPVYADTSNGYYYDQQEGIIYYRLNPVSMKADYYVSFDAQTPQNYTLPGGSYEAKADYGFVFINGDVIEGSNIGSLNESYAQQAAFNVTARESLKSDGSIDYVIRLNKQDTASYAIRNMLNTLPEGYVLKADSLNVTFSNEAAKNSFTVSANAGSRSFSIHTPANQSGYVVNNNDEWVEIAFTGVPTDTATKRRENTFVLTYAPPTSANETQNNNSVTIVSDSTNNVQSEARWLYLNVEKTIDKEDKEQSFLFKVNNESDTEGAGYIFTDLMCENVVTEAEKAYYKGSQVIQLGERGFYDVTETDWSDTDYDFSENAVYTATDVDYGERLNTVTATLQAHTDNSFYLPRVMYASTAFPLWAVEDEDGNILYPTVSCYNKESEYAWLSAQGHVTNSFTYGDTVATTATRMATQLPLTVKDEPVSGQAIGAEPITLKKKETE